jgi:glucose dehydrogenase
MTQTLLIAAVASAALSFAANAAAAIPMFNATCPGKLDVHADEGGPVYVNGRETTLKRFNDNYFEARDGKTGTTVSITRTPDGGMQVSYTGPKRANGACTLVDEKH